MLRLGFPGNGNECVCFCSFGKCLGGGYYHLVFLAGVICSLFLTWAAADFISSKRAISLVGSLAITAVGFACVWVLPASGMAMCAGMLLFGVGFGLVYCLYGELVSWFFFSNVKRYILGIFLAAMACVLLVVVCGRPARTLLAVVFPMLAFACYAVEFKYLKSNMPEEVSSSESDSRCRVKIRSYLATATAGLVSGFALGGAFLSIPASLPFPGAFVAGPVILVLAFLFRDAACRNRMTESISMKLFLPYSALVVFPLMFVGPEFRLPFLVLLLCGSLLPETCSLSAICRHVSLFSLSAVRTFAFGRFWSVIGIFLGWGIAELAFSDTLFASMDQTLRVSGCVIMFMLLIIFSASFVMTKDNYPTESDAKKSADVQSGIPLRDFVDAAVDSASKEPEGERSRPGKFYLQCEVVAKEYGLSARQREVLGMLARGRNADYITEKLIISAHTAKAHIYNIYQKTGVHSRQELMDLVEDADISDSNPVVQKILSELAIK